MNSDPSHLTILLIMFAIQAFTGVGIAIIGSLIKRNLAAIDKRLEDGDTRFREFAGKIEKLQVDRGFDREYFSKTYVDKDDFIRDIRAMDTKIEDVARDVKKLLVLSGGGKEKGHENL